MSHGIVRIIRKLQIKIHHIRSKFDLIIFLQRSIIGLMLIKIMKK